MRTLAVAWTTPGQARVPAFWQRLATCETGHIGTGYSVRPRWNWGAKHRPKEGKKYEGGVGFFWATWRLWASELGLSVQVRVAAFGLARGGYWGCLHQ